MSFAFDLTILGSNSSYPFNGRMCTSQIVRADQNLYMIDCGEGTQLQLSKFGVSRNKIKAIFISHFHGDHLYGLPGVLTSYMHFERRDPLLVIGPVGLKKYLSTVFEVSQVYLQFELTIIETNWETSGLIYEDQKVIVYNFPLTHRIPTQGFVFISKENERNIIPEKIKEFSLTHLQLKKIKLGETVITQSGRALSPHDVCYPPTPSRKYVFVSDTSPLEHFPQIVMNADLFYHEATYLKNLESLAISRGHSTSVHAARAAQEVCAKKLILGHFSSRYLVLDDFLEESKPIFENSNLALDGEVHRIG